MTIAILMVVILYVFYFSLAKAASKDNYKDFEQFNLDFNIETKNSR